MNEPTLPIVYADESNNTGENLQDADQPVFTVAGIHLDDDHANNLVESVKKSLQQGAGEPKYSILSRRPRGRAALMSALRDLPDASVKVFVADKRFMTVSKIIDLGIEPLAFADGYNMYADESARTLAHLVALTGPVLGSRKRFDAVLNAFVAAALRHSDPREYILATEQYLSTVARPNRPTLMLALLPSRDWLPNLVTERNNGDHPDTLDPAIPTIVSVCQAFFKTLGPIHLVHDKSKVIDRNKDLLLSMDQLRDPADPSRTVEPAGIKKIDFGDSKDIAQLMIADWAAGAARDVALGSLNPARRTVSQELRDLVDGWLAAPPLWPDPDWLTTHLRINTARQESRPRLQP